MPLLQAEVPGCAPPAAMPATAPLQASTMLAGATWQDRSERQSRVRGLLAMRLGVHSSPIDLSTRLSEQSGGIPPPGSE